MFAKPDMSDAAGKVAIAPGLSSGRFGLLLAAKVIVSLSLLAWILSRASLREIFGAVASASMPLLLAAYLIDFVGCLTSVTRWRLLIRTQTPPPWRFLLQSYFVAAFFNNFLPSTVGGDASRAYDCYRVSGGSGQAASSVVVDRLLGLLVLVLFALIALPLATRLTDHLPELRLELGLGVLGLFGVILAIFFGSAGSGWHRLFARLPTRLVQTLALVWRAFASYRGQWRPLLKAFALSVLLQANVVLSFVLIARALHLEVPPQSFFLIVPLATFVTMLPVSINGIGLRENALGAMLAWYGVPAADAVALAWLVYLSSLLFGLIGGVVYGLRR
jgi:glycosyltransferase 2 family protein